MARDTYIVTLLTEGGIRQVTAANFERFIADEFPCGVGLRALQCAMERREMRLCAEYGRQVNALTRRLDLAETLLAQRGNLAAFRH
jgi:hypothetical protein